MHLPTTLLLAVVAAVWQVGAVGAQGDGTGGSGGGGGGGTGGGTQPPRERDPVKLVNAGDREFRNEGYEAAVRLYSEALALAPAPRTYYARHKAFLKLRKIPSAIADLSAAVAADPEYTMAYLQRANLYLLTGRCDESAADYATVLHKDGSKRDAVVRLPHARACAEALVRAEGAARAGAWGAVREALGEAMEAERATAAPALLLRRAEASYELGELEEALADAARVLKMEAASLPAYELRARALARYGDYGTARSHYQECLRYDPEHKECKRGYHAMKAVLRVRDRGEAAAAAGDWAGAAAAWGEGRGFEPANPTWQREVLPKLARAHLRHGDMAAAASVANEAVAADDGAADAHAVLAEVAMAGEAYEEAVRRARRAAELSRDAYGELAQRAEAALKQSKSKDYYKILGVPRNADERTIKKAYRGLAHKYHPDMHTDPADKEAAEVKFRDVAEAHDVLTDPEKKGRYDRGEDVSGNPQQPPPGHGFHPFGGGGGGFTFTFRAG